MMKGKYDYQPLMKASFETVIVFKQPRLEHTAQEMAQYTDDQSQVWYHAAIQASQGVAKDRSKKITQKLAITFWK